MVRLDAQGHDKALPDGTERFLARGQEGMIVADDVIGGNDQHVGLRVLSAR
jgi:hypothetical protein